jgi:hypothetical protein
MNKATWEKEREIKRELGKRRYERLKQTDVERKVIVTKDGKKYIQIGNRLYTYGPKGELRRVKGRH